MKCKRLLAVALTVAALMSLFVMPTSASADRVCDVLRDEIDWLDHWFTYDTSYMTTRIGKLYTSFEGERTAVVPADEYEDMLRAYFVITDAQIQEIRNANYYQGAYNADDHTYTVRYNLGAGGTQKREYGGYVKNGNRYDMYYKTIKYTHLVAVYDEEMPYNEYVAAAERVYDPVVGRSAIVYKGVMYYSNFENYSAREYLNSGRLYTVEMNGDIVRIVSVKDVDSMPAAFDDYFFADIKEGTWYYDAVKFMSDCDYMNGYASGLFGPADRIQRQDFVLMLARMRGADFDAYAGQNGGLSDVPAKSYYSAAVAWAVDNGIITGYENGKFGVGDAVNREQVATILYRYNGAPAVENAEETLAAFPDADTISPFAREATAWAVQEGLISGMQSGDLAPRGVASRAQVATIIYRMYTN